MHVYYVYGKIYKNKYTHVYIHYINKFKRVRVCAGTVCETVSVCIYIYERIVFMQICVCVRERVFACVCIARTFKYI